MHPGAGASIGAMPGRVTPRRARQRTSEEALERQHREEGEGREHRPLDDDDAEALVARLPGGHVEHERHHRQQQQKEEETAEQQHGGAGSPGLHGRGEPGGRLPFTLERGDLPGVLVGQQFAQQPVVHRVARAEGAVGRQQRPADDVEVADGVEDLVLHELVVIAQAVGIEHLVVVHDDGVVEPAAQGQAARAHHLHVLREAEGARARDVARVVARAEVELHALAGGIHGGVGEVDFEAQLVAVVGLEPRPLELLALALAHLDGARDADELLRCVLQHHAGALQQEHEGGRRAVEDGHFLGRDVDVEIVQPQSRAGRHEVLDRVHLGAAHADGGGHARIHDGFGPDRDVHGFGQVDAAENDARVRRGGTQRELDPLATVQAHADGAGEGLDRALLEHPAILGGGTRPCLHRWLCHP